MYQRRLEKLAEFGTQHLAVAIAWNLDVQWAADSSFVSADNVGVYLSGRNIIVPQQLLNAPNIGTALQ